MQTQTAVSSANSLLQSVESALPKQKKAQAVTEFKRAIIAHKRYSKVSDIQKGLFCFRQTPLSTKVDTSTLLVELGHICDYS